MSEENKESQLSVVKNNYLAKVSSTLSITNKLLNEINSRNSIVEEIESIFNKAFIFMNSKKFLGSNFNFYLHFDTDIDNIKKVDWEANNQHDYKIAKEFYDKVIEIKDTHSLSYIMRGICYFKMNQFEMAIDDFTRANELKPNSYFSLKYRGITKIRIKQYDEAIKDLTSALSLDTTDANIHFNLGMAYYKIDDIKNAIKSLGNAIEIDSFYEEAYLNRGNIKDKIDNYRDAVEDYSKILEINPNNLSAFRNRIFSRHSLGIKNDDDRNYFGEVERNYYSKKSKEPDIILCFLCGYKSWSGNDLLFRNENCKHEIIKDEDFIFF